MYTSLRALKQAKESGEPLPYVPALKALYDRKCFPRKGQLIMVVGRPGSQKSGFTMWYVAQMGLSGIYVSSDMSAHTAVTRLASIYTGETSDEVSERLSEGDDEEIKQHLASSTVHLVFDSQPSLEDLDNQVYAYVELYDKYPDWIVIDNLLDTEALGENDYASMKGLLLEFKDLARKTGTTIIVTHHANEVSDPRYPASSKEIQMKIAQTPELILSVALEPSDGETNMFRLAVIKNRTGPSDPSAKRFIELIAQPSRTRFYGNDIYSRAAAHAST